MKKVILVIPILAIIFGGYFLRQSSGQKVTEEKVLSEQLVNLPSPTPLRPPDGEATEGQAPTPTPTPKPTIKLTPTPTFVPQPTFTSEEINGFIERFAAQYGVSPHVLRHIALCESGFNPQARKLSYAGLYQFTANTWKKYRQLMGEEINPDLRFNAEEAVQTAAYILSINKAFIWPSCNPS